jgi:DNA processing protein
MGAEHFGQSREQQIDDLQIAVSLLGGLSCRERVLLTESVTSRNILFRLHTRAVEEIVGRRLRGRVIPEDWEERSERIATLAERGGFRILHFWDGRYPPQLREIYDPPFLLYMRGKLPAAELPSAAVVGTRRPSETARQAAFRLGAELSLANVPVVSGLARGIDAAAHRGAVRTGGVTIAVEATGIDRVYPSGHRDLASKILENGGALLSEYPPGVEVRRYRFPERNRLISGLSRSVVVVQAPTKSGALITADYALEQGRELLVHEAGLAGTAGAGGRRLRDEGAETVRSAAEVIREWDVAGLRRGNGLRELSRQGMHRNEIGRHETDRKETDKHETSRNWIGRHEDSASRLLEEELDGRVIRYGGTRYRRVG